MANEIAKYEPGRALIEQAIGNIESVKDLNTLNAIQDKAAALREGARQARQPKIVWNYFMATAIIARWQIGKLLPDVIQRGGDQAKAHDETLLSIGVDKTESHRWQLLARIPQADLKQHIEEYDTETKTLTFNGCYKLLPKPEAPEGSFDVIIIDPPWEMKKIARSDRPNQEDIDYTASMDVAEIIEWGKGNLHPFTDCHLFLWTTQKYLPFTFRILAEWGMKYVCTFVWHKPGGFQPVGLPQYNCEFIVYSRKGNPVFSDTKGLSTCFSAPRGAHSEKPDAFYEMIARSTTGKRIAMFERKERPGFQVWGDEI